MVGLSYVTSRCRHDKNIAISMLMFETGLSGEVCCHAKQLLLEGYSYKLSKPPLSRQKHHPTKLEKPSWR